MGIASVNIPGEAPSTTPDTHIAMQPVEPEPVEVMISTGTGDRRRAQLPPGQLPAVTTTTAGQAWVDYARDSIRLLCYNKLSLLLIFFPVAVGLGASNASPGATLTFALLGIIPLAGILDTVTEQLALFLSGMVRDNWRRHAQWTFSNPVAFSFFYSCR